MQNVRIFQGDFPSLFGGIGFHNNDANYYTLMDKEHFRQIVCKNYREISPGFMRGFLGFSDWTKEAMDSFAEYYEQMQKWTDTPMYFTPANGMVHFSDEEIQTYCEDVADRLAYLYFEKNVKHIRYYCFSNELSREMWGVLRDDLPTFRKYHVGLFRAFRKRHLPIGLLATDASGYDAWDTVDWAIDNMADITEDYCVHIYENTHDIRDLSFYDFFLEKCEKIVAKAVRNFGKRVLITEFGVSRNPGNLVFFGNVASDVCSYFSDPEDEATCALMLTEMVFAGIRAGIFAFALWSFIDHPDPYSCAWSTGDDYAKRWSRTERFLSCTADYKYNKWGMTKWNDEGDFGPRKLYWCMAPLMHYFKRNAKVLEVECDDPLLRCASIRNRDGSVTFGVVNRHTEETQIRLLSSLFRKPIRVYEYDSKNVPENRFCDMQAPVTTLPPTEPTYTLKAESVTFFTTDYREKTASVFAKDVEERDGVLSWKAVTDEEHCYYRVFASDEKDFTPSYENQIASTVATELPLSEKRAYYKVLSVDKSGNI